MKKQLLKENEIRKFMKFANIGALSDGFVERLNEDVETLEEEDTLEEEETLEEEDTLEEAEDEVKYKSRKEKTHKDLKSMEESLDLLEQEDDLEDDLEGEAEAEGDMDAEMGGEGGDPEAEMDDMDDEMGGEMDAEGGEGGDVLELVQDALEKFVEALEAAGPAGQEAARNLSIEAGEGEEDAMAADAGDAGGPVGDVAAGPEDEEGMPPMAEDLVNEVARRVARRLRRIKRR